MLKSIETTGRTEEDAISAALFQLGLERDDVSVEVLERAKSGFLGFGSNPAKVRVSYEEENGTPKSLKDLMEEEVLSTAKTPAPKPEKAASAFHSAPAPRPEPKPAQSVRPEPKKEQESPAVQAVEEETILAAKPGMRPPQPRPERRRSEPKPRRAPRPEERPQAGDELVMQAPPKPREPVIVTPAAEDDEKANRIKDFLTGLLERLEVQAVPDVYATSEGGYKVILQGENLGTIIGRRGETLDAIQQLTSYALNHGQSKRTRVHVDAEGYRAKREESLRRLAVKMAGKAVKYRRNMTLEPMNAYERHVIHTALQDYPNVSTYSTGVDPNRRTVVAYTPGQK